MTFCRADNVIKSCNIINKSQYLVTIDANNIESILHAPKSIFVVAVGNKKTKAVESEIRV